MFSRASVILSTGVSPQADTPWADTPRADTLPWADTLLGRRPQADTPSPQQMATAADGTHSTGMHSCLELQLHNNDLCQ